MQSLYIDITTEPWAIQRLVFISTLFNRANFFPRPLYIPFLYFPIEMNSPRNMYPRIAGNSEMKWGPMGLNWLTRLNWPHGVE